MRRLTNSLKSIELHAVKAACATICLSLAALLEAAYAFSLLCGLTYTFAIPWLPYCVLAISIGLPVLTDTEGEP